MKKSIIDLIYTEGLDEQAIAELRKNVVKGTVKKGEVLIRKGDPASHMYCVEKGLLRSFVIDEHGKEHIFMFAPEGWFFSDFESVDKEAVSAFFIDALEDSEIEMIDKKHLSQPNIAMKDLKHLLESMRRRVSVLEKRVVMLLSASAKERYQHFVTTYPEIVQRVPQRMIASYLGITPESLSRIRKDL